MGNFSDNLPALDDAVFDHLGDPASWAGLEGTVQIILAEPDEVAQFGQSSSVIVPTRILQVRRSEVAAPIKGDIVCPGRMEAAVFVPGARSLKIIARPQLDEVGTVWRCEAADIP